MAEVEGFYRFCVHCTTPVPEEDWASESSYLLELNAPEARPHIAPQGEHDLAIGLIVKRHSSSAKP
jgi:hypothetical protein